MDSEDMYRFKSYDYFLGGREWKKIMVYWICKFFIKNINLNMKYVNIFNI